MTSRLGTGKSINFFYSVYKWGSNDEVPGDNFVNFLAPSPSTPPPYITPPPTLQLMTGQLSVKNKHNF